MGLYLESPYMDTRRYTKILKEIKVQLTKRTMGFLNIFDLESIISRPDPLETYMSCLFSILKDSY
jgi:hypothetical protein